MSIKPKISIIMPVYKVEKYVRKAIESIQQQTFQEYEFLIVDDGTPDKSGEICDQYAKENPRIKVIHKENGGAPSARNTAMKIAKGKYYYFMDSDDWVEPTMLEDMYLAAEKNNAQLIITGFFIETYYTKEKHLTQILSQPNKIYLNKESFRTDAYKLFDTNLLYTPWNKLYQADYIKKNKLYFPNTFWDDFPFVLSVIRDIERVTVLEKPYYHFIRARAESETAAYRPQMYEKREEEHQWMLELYRHWQINDEASQEMVARRYVERLIGCIENITNKKCGFSKKEKKEQIRKMITNEVIRECIKKAKPHSKMMKIMLIPIKTENVTLVFLESKIITNIKTKNTRLFAALKARR